MNNRLFQNTIVVSAGTFISKGILFALTIFFSYQLTAEAYGRLDIFTTYITLLIPLIGFDSDVTMFRFAWTAEQKSEKISLITNCFFIYSVNVVVCCIILLVYGILSGWELWFSFSILIVGEIYNHYLGGYLRATKRLTLYSICNIVTTIFVAVLSIIVGCFVFSGLKWVILGYGIGYILGDLFIIFVSKYWEFWNVRHISFSAIKRLISFSYSLIPNDMAWWVINASDRTVIRFFLGSSANGIYAMAYKLPNILSQIISPFNFSWQQSATEHISEKENTKYFNSVYNNATVVFVSFCCIVLSLNSLVFSHIFDRKYIEGIVYVPILIGGTVVAFLNQFYGSMQIANKCPEENGRTAIVGAASNFFIHILFVKKIGLFAAALSTLLSQIIVCIIRKKKQIELLS